MCCTQAKLALPVGGTPYSHRLSSRSRSPPQSDTLKGGIGEDVVGLQVWVAVIVEAVAVGDVALYPAKRQVHLGQLPSGVVGLLAPDGDVAPRLAAVAVAGGVGIDELHRLHEHAGGAAAGVVDPALVRFQHLHQELDDATRGVELAALLALGAGELGEEVLVHPTQHVFGASFRVSNLDVGDQVDKLAQPGLVQGGAGVVLGQHVLERQVVPLDGGHGVVHQLADDRLPRLRLEMRPAGLRRHPEDALASVFVHVFRVIPLCRLRLQPSVQLLKGVGDVLEEDEAEDDVLVLGGVHAAPKGVGQPPELGFVTCQSAAARFGVRAGGSPSLWHSRHDASPLGLLLERHLSTSRRAFLPPGPYP